MPNNNKYNHNSTILLLISQDAKSELKHLLTNIEHNHKSKLNTKCRFFRNNIHDF